MPSVNLNQTEYYGTVSTPPSGREAGPRESRHCGSSLATRYQGVRLIGERPTRIWKCRCEHERWQPVEAAAA